MHLPHLDAAALAAALPPAVAVDALERALRAGADPGADPPRTAVPGAGGELLVMPSTAAGGFAVKLVTVGPAGRQPRVQGVLVLFDAATLAPAALVDGAALTAVRTPAVSALAVRHLAAPDACRLVVFGTGPQGEGHVAALRAVRPVADVVIVGRDRSRAAALADRCGGRVGSAADVEGADLVVCATTAREPLFDGRLVADHACVVAVGSHEPTAREVDAGLVHRSRVVVEDVATALREAGDLVLAGVPAERLQPLAELVRGGPRPHRGPSLVKTVGMAWEDAVLAARAAGRTPGC